MVSIHRETDWSILIKRNVEKWMVSQVEWSSSNKNAWQLNEQLPQYGKLLTINQFYDRVSSVDTWASFMKLLRGKANERKKKNTKKNPKHESDIPIGLMKFINWIVRRVFIFELVENEVISNETINYGCRIAIAAIVVAELHHAHMTCYHNRIDNHNCLFSFIIIYIWALWVL